MKHSGKKSNDYAMGSPGKSPDGVNKAETVKMRKASDTTPRKMGEEPRQYGKTPICK